MLVSTDQRTGPGSYGVLCPSSVFLPFPLFPGVWQFSKFWIQASRPRLPARVGPFTSSNLIVVQNVKVESFYGGALVFQQTREVLRWKYYDVEFTTVNFFSPVLVLGSQSGPVHVPRQLLINRRFRPIADWMVVFQ